MKQIIALIFTFVLVTSALAQEKPKRALTEMKKDLVNVNLKIENIQYKYQDLKRAQARLAREIRKTKEQAKKKVEKKD